MRKFLATFFGKLSDRLNGQGSATGLREGEGVQIPPPLLELQEIPRNNEDRCPTSPQKDAEKKRKPEKKTGSSLSIITKSAEIVSMGSSRDVMHLMDVPFLSLSKNRTEPIIYESQDGTRAVRVTRHSEHYIASVYDWDIILVVAGKLQEILNNGSDIPPRRITIPRHELLKALHKADERKTQKGLEKSLTRLKTTLIDTTIGNNRGGFGFIDSWEYKERENNRETRVIKITLSEWLYELCCAKGALLKTDQLYFDITSGLKKFLYRTARRHAGNNRDGWEFSVERLYEKSGSENDFRKFKAQLKKAVLENDIPSYSLKWIVKNQKPYVLFKNRKMQTINERAEDLELNFVETEEIDSSAA